MSYGLTTWTTSTEITQARVQQFADSIEWRHLRIPYVFDLEGNLVDETAGVGLAVGYVTVNPYTYEGYLGAGAHFGQFRLSFPPGLFTELISVRVQPASASNGAMTASVSAESADGVTVFVYDSGETAIEAFAVWVRAVGVLAGGKLP